jgi:predicted permease
VIVVPEWMTAFWLRIKALCRRWRLDRDLNDELQFHLAMRQEKLAESGVPADDAHYAARREFGNATEAKEMNREMWTFPFLETLWQDIRYGLRQLRRNPGFTAVAVVTLGLGIGANTAIFSVVEGVLLAPLPYPNANRLVEIFETLPRSGRVASISYPNFRDWHRDARFFGRMAAVGGSDYELTSPGTPEHVWGIEISSGFFSTLGVKLKPGREFTVQEDQPGGARVAIISNRMWRNRFASSPHVLGKVVELNGVDRTIVGVAPRRFDPFGFPSGPNVYTPLAQRNPAYLNPRGNHADLLSVAQLKPGVNIARAQAEMNTIQAHLDRVYPNSDRGLGAKVVSLKQQIVGDVSGTLLLLLGAVGVLLLIACANVANLLLVRSAARSREFAIRSALGAGRARVVRQLMTESIMLAMAGGALGLLLARWAVKPVLAIVPGSLPRSYDIHLNVPVLLFAFGVAVAVGVLFGLAPALKSAKSDLQEALKEGGRTVSSGPHRTQNSLVIFQVALTLVLLAGAGLLFRTIRQLSGISPGFEARHVITFNVGFSPSASRTGAGTRHAYQQLVERIRQISGVQAADVTYILPIGDDNTAPFWIGTGKPAAIQAAPRMQVFDTGPDYLRVMRIPLLRGRFFTRQDNLKSPCVAAIDSVFARTYFPDKDPLGQTLTFGWTPPWGPCRIVGVVGHVRHSGLNVPGTYTRAESYFPLYQVPNQYWAEGLLGGMAIVVRTPLAPAVIMPEIKNVVYSAGRQQTVYDVETMEQILASSMWQRRLPMILLGMFAGLALLLASVGIYGVVSYGVTQRTHEIGIRLALGARQGELFRMVIGLGLRLVLEGLLIGAGVALILGRVLSSFSHLIYGVGTADPLTFGGVAIVLTLVSVLACYIPARRAARVDPMVALRCE